MVYGCTMTIVGILTRFLGSPLFNLYHKNTTLKKNLLYLFYLKFCYSLKFHLSPLVVTFASEENGRIPQYAF